MIYLNELQLPNAYDVNHYFASTNLTLYPFNIFFYNQLEEVTFKDITIFYGNNGSGKTTLLKVINDKLQNIDKSYYNDAIYLENGTKLYPFKDFTNKCKIKMDMIKPTYIKYIRSQDIFNYLNDIHTHNQKRIEDIEKVRAKRDEIYKKGYTFKSSADLADLIEYNKVKRMTKVSYVRANTSKEIKVLSNGETAFNFINDSIELDSLYLLDEPENCLSPQLQLKLVDLIVEAVRYYSCQFIIATHSPLILSLHNALIYDLDTSPIITKNFEELTNVKIYYEFFKKHKDKFK